MSKVQSLADRFLQKPGYLGKGAGYLAKQFNTDTDTIYKAKALAKDIMNGNEVAELSNLVAAQEEIIVVQDREIKKKVNQKGDCDVTGVINKRVVTLEDLVAVCEIDLAVWEIISWECNKWEVGAKNPAGTVETTPLFQVKAKLRPLSKATAFTTAFQEFLGGYQPSAPIYKKVSLPGRNENALLVLPKQDAHFNRIDVLGRNDIHERFRLIEDTTMSIVAEASGMNNLQKITYIVGSDQFNSEWTGLTTNGTPQENLLGYQEAFKLICDHEITIIENLLENAERVEILFVPGNHDEYAGWHLINWLACYYRDNQYITVTEGNPSGPRRYERYGTTAIMYDHGAYMNGKQLAQVFPIEFRKEWSVCDNFYIFSGDKHHEMSLDVQGIKYYRVPALTPTKSKWEHKKGYVTPGEMQAFLIREGQGLTNIYSRLLE